MPIGAFLFLGLVISSCCAEFHKFQGQRRSGRIGFRLSKPLIEDDGTVYACSERNLYAFQSNGSISWDLPLAFTCNVDLAPVLGGKGKMYLVAENRVLEISFLGVGEFPPTSEVFFGPEKGQPGAGDIIGIVVCVLSSTVFINLKNRGLFAYSMHGRLRWSVGPVLSQFGYRLGCRKGIADCYFASAPVIDQCEASIYISNTAGEVYSLSVRTPHFNWVQDLSSFDNVFTVTAGNNGHLYVTVHSKALVLALDVFKGSILWQMRIGPLNAADHSPVVDSNGWLSVGSLDGILYSISPTGVLRKFMKVSQLDHVIQVDPFLDCSGSGVYISQTDMEGKVSHVIGNETYISAMKAKGAVFTLLIPETGKIHWSERYPGELSSALSQSDLQNFDVDERIFLAFIAASRTRNPLQCRSKHMRLLSTCSMARPKRLGVYSGNQRMVMLFLLFESIALVIFAVLVRFCCIFWRKKKLQGQDLANFLNKRRALQLKKKEFDRTIKELKQKAADEAVANEVIDELGNLIREREGIERRLSTTYSLGRDRAGFPSNSLLPMYNGRSRSYSFQRAKKESVTIFHTLSDTSFEETSSDRESSSWEIQLDNRAASKGKGKAKARTSTQAGTSSGDRIMVTDFRRSPCSSEPASISKLYRNPLHLEQETSGDELLDVHDKSDNDDGVVESTSVHRKGLWLKRRAFSSSN